MVNFATAPSASHFPNDEPGNICLTNEILVPPYCVPPHTYCEKTGGWTSGDEGTGGWNGSCDEETGNWIRRWEPENR